MRRQASNIALAAVAIAGLLASVPAVAGTWSLQFENDRVADTDRHYTHGSRLAWLSDRTEEGPQWTKDVLQFLYPFASIRGGRIGLALGQNIYTPEDTEATGLVANDRPYAGWLYLAASVHAEARQTIAGLDYDTLDSVELNLGIVGPAAGGEAVQNRYHRLIGVDESRGWDNQLANEPAVALVAERKWRPAPWRLGVLEADGIPYLGAAVGNVLTMVDAGVTLRIGQSLGIDYGPPHVRPTLAGLAAVAPGRPFAWYVFGGLEGRVVLHDIFLDGNTFADSHAVDRTPLVGDALFGVAVVVHGMRLALSHVYRTREFDGQRRADRYGAISLSVRF